MAGWAWHVLIQPRILPKALALVSCGLWLLAQLYKLVLLFIRGRATIENLVSVKDGTVLRLGLDRPIPFFPGCYYNIIFPGPMPLNNLFQGYPMVPFWSSSKGFETSRTDNLSFLLASHGHHDISLACAKVGSSVRLDGPYGKDLRLHKYENVILVASGTGIVGILPIAKDFAIRQKNDILTRKRKEAIDGASAGTLFLDATCRVDVFWWLEDTAEEDWVKEELRELQSLQDPEIVVNTLPVVCCR